MKKNPLPLVIIFMSVLTFLGCGQKENNANQQVQGPMPYTVIEVPQKDLTGFTEFPTTIQGIVNSDVRAKVSGYIQKVLVDEGQAVKKGQALFQLETQTLSQDAAAAKASVNAAQVAVDKLKPLVDKGIISNVQLETQKAKLEQAKSNYNSILANIGYGTVKSQVDGHVGAINFREGSLVSPTTTLPLTTISDTKQVYAYFSMNESQYLDFLESTSGKTLQEKLNNFPNVSLFMANGKIYDEKGKIQTVTGQIDPSAGTVSFRAVFNNPTQLLTNGNSGTIEIPKTFEKALVVPQSVTFEQQGQTFVYKVGEDNKAIATLIQVEADIDQYYVVGSGLNPGDLIVGKGISKLRNGTPIQPQPIAFDSIAKPIKPLFQ